MAKIVQRNVLFPHRHADHFDECDFNFAVNSDAMLSKRLLLCEQHTCFDDNIVQEALLFLLICEWLEHHITRTSHYGGM